MRTLEQIIGATLAAQVRLVPQPEDLRGHILAKINAWVPEGQDVEKWLMERDAELEAATAPPSSSPTPESSPTPTPPWIEVECWEEGTERGTTTFTRGYTARGIIRMTEDELGRLLRGAASREDAIEEFVRWASDNHEAISVGVGGEDFGVLEVTDSERDDRGDNSREAIRRYLDAHPEITWDEDEEENEDEEDDDD